MYQHIRFPTNTMLQRVEPKTVLLQQPFQATFCCTQHVFQPCTNMKLNTHTHTPHSFHSRTSNLSSGRLKQEHMSIKVHQHTMSIPSCHTPHSKTNVLQGQRPSAHTPDSKTNIPAHPTSLRGNSRSRGLSFPASLTTLLSHKPSSINHMSHPAADLLDFRFCASELIWDR